MNLSTRHLELIAGYVDGTATQQELRDLEQALRVDASLRRQLLRYLNIDSALASLTVSIAPDNGGAVRKAAHWWWLAPLATAALIVLALWRPWNAGAPTGVPAPQARSTTRPAPASATLAATTHARWADADIELSLRGGDLPATPLRLESGLAEFKFVDGATALVLGPATVQFSGENQLFLRDGKVLCRCPTPASRLTVVTPATRVVDWGTEFAVDVAVGRPDTRVAVVSGEVRVGTDHIQVLRTGEAAEVGPDQVVRLTPLPPDALAELLAADASRTASRSITDLNLLLDADFVTGSSGPWRCTEGHVDFSATPTGQALVIAANGHRFWPSARQSITTGDIAGRLVVASVVARTPGSDPLTERQAGILKITFMDAQGREFATASRHFLHAASSAMVIDQPVTSQVAAFAPPGTQKVEMQLMLSARGRPGGVIEFTQPKLVVLPTTAPSILLQTQLP